MQNVVSIVHVLAAILLLGPVTVAISMFPKLALAARGGEAGTVGAARTMHAISRTYGMWSLLVPLLGFGVMFTDVSTYMKSGAMHAAILLAIIAWALLFFLIIPRQRLMMAGLGIADEDEDVDDPEFIERRKKADELDWDKQKGQLAMFSGIFSLLWVVAGILMFFI
ncbi:DUF2269 domain-containing protein [Corynebacterium amycolatum]|uniref:DUF2269 domain-containing protein n=1 Tax=Corynebacterium amycolatum TaxID=43765 RepID=UPI0009757F17|nr:DUF2269 domain-containing protein [Corynebacterium amycolatum]OMQ08843.1 DUF2269 domain-containing protein [Corynebacterium amycolatum]